MRKIIVITFVLFIGIVTSKAQVKVSPGLRGGLNLSYLTNFDASNAKADFYVGGFVNIKFNKYFSIQPELTYTRQGSNSNRYDGPMYDNNGQYINSPFKEIKYQLDYVSLGTVAKFNIKGSGFHVLAGPSIDFKTYDNFGKNNTSYRTDIVGVDLAFVGGVGYTLPNGLTFEARFKQGFIDIYGYDNPAYGDGNFYYDDIILNEVFQIGLSYTFKVK